MLVYPELEPVAFRLGALAVHWYGLMYAFGFLAAWWLGRRLARRPGAPVQPAQMDDLLYYLALGVILGGRLGYVLFYNFEAFLAEPLMLLRVWEGGMSFHGGMLGVLLAAAWYRRRRGVSYLQLTDFVAPLVPLGLGLGRLGNFINGELWGRPSDLPWAMIYPPLGAQPRHPSQLYEFLLEGMVLFLVLWLVARRPRPLGLLSALFLLGYGSARFAVEFVRLPDAHIGYLAWGWLTQGQLLTLPMLLTGAGLLLWIRLRVPPAAPATGRA